MKPFTFQAPPNILFEAGASKKLAELVSVYGAKRILLVTDKGVRNAASYNAVASAPWTEASKRFLETMSAAGKGGTVPDWREAFAKWSEISNEELIRNQRTDGFLQAQKELLQAGLQLRSRQDDVAEAASAMFGLPTRTQPEH